ncbi:MAG: hypothetical protein MZV63_58355 [Marinilabiliales bacterium]|nr:hypothetical protein [Marinilabiliales bacterium]
MTANQFNFIFPLPFFQSLVEFGIVNALNFRNNSGNGFHGQPGKKVGNRDADPGTEKDGPKQNFP